MCPELKMTVSADDVVPSGFRFDPTDEELVLCYLKRKICNQKIKPDIIAETNVYKSDPEELPGQSLLKAGNKQWFFFSPRDGKYPNGASSNRATRLGYWKATGKDRTITYSSLNIGVKKILVFSRGRAPNGERTDWMMHEYTLHEEELKRCQNVQDCYALCKVFKKSGPGPKNGEQYGAPSREEDWVDDEVDVTKTVDTDSPAMQLNGGIDPAGGGRANDQVPYALYNLEEIMRQSADDAESQINCGYELPPKVFGQEEAQSSTLLKRASREVIFPKQDRVCDEPAGVDFTQLSPSNLQLFEAPEVTSAPPQDYEQVLQLCQEGFLEMNDLISPESTFSAVENPVENLQFDELDGMSLFDLNDDAAMFPNGMGPIYQDMNVPGNDVLNQVDHQFQPHSLENQVDQQLQQNIVVNQVDYQFQSNSLAKLPEHQVKPNFIVNQVQLQPATSGTDLISTQPWMQQQQSNLFTPADSNQGILCQTTSGTVEEVTQPLAEASENQNGQEGGGDTTSWLSSFIWAYVESIPTSSASASEIPLMNPAFEQVSGFSRIRANARNTNVAGCNRPVTRRQGGGIGFLILSILGILCAILWMLMGTVRVLGRCKFSS